MQKKTKRLILFVIAAIAVAASVTVYLVWNKPHKNIKDAAAAELTAVELYESFITDSLKASLLYADKVVQVSGKIARLFSNQQAQQVILIKTTVEGAYINCTMEKPVAGVNEADSIIIKGICSGYISGDADMGLPGDVFLIRGYKTDIK